MKIDSRNKDFYEKTIFIVFFDVTCMLKLPMSLILRQK